MSVAASYFFFFAIFGLFLPYLTPVLVDLGFAKHQIGLLHGSFSLISVLMPALIGRASDKWLSVDRVIRIAALLILISAVGQLITAGKNVELFIVFMLLFAVARAPIVPLIDTLAMQKAAAEPGAYARLRVMGSLGFICSAVLFSALTLQSLVQTYFIGILALAILFFLTTVRLPQEKKPLDHVHTTKFWSTLDRTWWVWLLAMVLHWMCFGPYHYGFSLLLEEQNIDAKWIGPIWSIGVASEIVVFLASRWFFARWQTRTLLFVALLSSLLRWSLLAIWPTPGVIVFSQLLHGTGFALFYAAAVDAIHRYCRGIQHASYQSLFSTCLAGGGNVIGMSLSGFLHETMDFHQMLAYFVPIQILAIAVLTRVRLADSRPPKIVEESPEESP